MSVIRVGSTSTYADGWEQIFGGGRRGPAKPVKQAAKKPAKKGAGKQQATKKAAPQKPASKKPVKRKAKLRGR